MIRVGNHNMPDLQDPSPTHGPLVINDTIAPLPLPLGIATTQESPKSPQSLPLKESQDDVGKQSISSQSSINSASLSQGSSDLASLGDQYNSEETDPIYIKGVLRRAKTILEEDKVSDQNVKEVLQALYDSLQKVRNESNQYKIKAQLLSISSKDADMRYEVENELVKREVDRLKTQGHNIDYYMNKINHQKQTLKKYKNEIINKNREILNLRSKQNMQQSSQNGHGKRHSFSSHSTSNGTNNINSFKRSKRNSEDSNQEYGLNTLGMLASQVLTEEEKSTRSFQR